MHRNTELLPPRMIEITKEFQDDASLSMVNITEKALSTPTLKSKWVSIYIEEKRFYNILKKKEEMFLDEYVKKYGHEDVPKRRIELEARQSDELKKIRTMIEDQSVVVEYLENMCKIMHSFGFDISSAKDLLKMES